MSQGRRSACAGSLAQDLDRFQTDLFRVVFGSQYNVPTGALDGTRDAPLHC